MFTSDIFVHSDINRGLYGSVPYITGHSKTFDSSLLWLNAADTWIDLLKKEENQMLSNFVSESGQIELFIFSSDCPKKQIKSMALITGYQPMPPI